MKVRAAYVEHHQQLREAADFHSHGTDRWGLEILRGLLMLNSAGLAGVVVLVEGGERSLFGPFTQFAIGLVLAVLAMLSGRMMHSAASEGWYRVANAFADSPDQELRELYPDDVLKVDSWHGLTFAFGITSGIAAVAGGALLFFTLA